MKAHFFIDPGVNGGIAITLGGLDNLLAMNLDGIGSLMDIMADYECYDRHMVIEDVPSYVGRNIPSHAAFKLGKSCGLVEGMARGMKIPCKLIPPKVWQKGLPGLRGLTGVARKRVLKEHAQRLFPKARATLRTSDAILLANYFFSNP